MSERFHKLVFDISEQLNERDHEALNYIYNLSDKNSNNLRSLRELEKRGLFSYSDIHGLNNILKDINRSDLIEMVEAFKQSHCPSSSQSSCTFEDSGDLVKIRLCFLKARDFKDRLSVLQKMHQDFSLASEESATSSVSAKCQFCEEMTKQLKGMEQDVDRFFIAPLMELIDSTGELATHASNLQAQRSHTLSRRVERSVSYTVPSHKQTHSTCVHLQAPGNHLNGFSSHSAHNIPSILNADEDRDGVDYETWVIIAEPEHHENQTRAHPAHAPRTKVGENTRIRATQITTMSRFSNRTLIPKQISQPGFRTTMSTCTRQSRIPVPVPQHQSRCTSSPNTALISRSESCDSLDVDTDFLSSMDSGCDVDIGTEDSQSSGRLAHETSGRLGGIFASC